MEITTDIVKTLREKTGCAVMECKRALQGANGDIEKAVDFLRKKGLASAEKKSGRATGEGIVESYIHLNSKIGVLVEVNCETDFVARNSEFKSFVRDIAMQITAAHPFYVSREEVEASHLEREKDIIRSHALSEGKSEQIVQKIVEGGLEKFYSEICLLEQYFIKDHSKKIMDLIKEQIAKFGENIVVKRFTRYQVGEKN